MHGRATYSLPAVYKLRFYRCDKIIFCRMNSYRSVLNLKYRKSLKAIFERIKKGDVVKVQILTKTVNIRISTVTHRYKLNSLLEKICDGSHLPNVPFTTVAHFLQYLIFVCISSKIYQRSQHDVTVK